MLSTWGYWLVLDSLEPPGVPAVIRAHPEVITTATRSCWEQHWLQPRLNHLVWSQSLPVRLLRCFIIHKVDKFKGERWRPILQRLMVKELSGTWTLWWKAMIWGGKVFVCSALSSGTPQISSAEPAQRFLAKTFVGRNEIISIWLGTGRRGNVSESSQSIWIKILTMINMELGHKAVAYPRGLQIRPGSGD